MKRCILLLAFLCLAGVVQGQDTSKPELNQIAALIFQNECGSKDACLTAWNEGEEFASLGIGHFIWYPAGIKQTFQESFPALLSFMQQRGARLPKWLSSNPQQANPWHNRNTFLAAYDADKTQVLRSFLQHYKALQAEFMQQRLRHALPKLLANLDADLQAHIDRQFKYVAASPMGMYVLMDYVNFKGEGTNPIERYQGQGWGMLQVLESMSVQQAGLPAIEAFARAADAMLTRRVALSPASRYEKRWLPGWRKRLATYVHESKQQLKKSQQLIPPK